MYRSAKNTNLNTIMKKIAFIAAAVFCSPVTFAQEAPATAPVVASASDVDVLADQMLAKIVEMVNVIETVEDRATADAAAEKINVIKEELKALTVKAESLGHIDESTEQVIAAKVMGVLFSLAPRIEACGAKMEDNDYFGSEALKSIINEF
jgi:hypothetical protein